MEYLWIASVTVMMASKPIWAVVMYFFLFYGCHRLPFPAFRGVKPWILAALSVCVAALLAPQIGYIQWGIMALQGILYFWIWHQCLRGIGQMEVVYGDLKRRGISAAYWVEMALAAAWICVPAFEGLMQPTILLLQVWKAWLMYWGYHDYEIRRRQLAKLSNDI